MASNKIPLRSKLHRTVDSEGDIQLFKFKYCFYFGEAICLSVYDKCILMIVPLSRRILQKCILSTRVANVIHFKK